MWLHYNHQAGQLFQIPNSIMIMLKGNKGANKQTSRFHTYSKGNATTKLAAKTRFVFSSPYFIMKNPHFLKMGVQVTLFIFRCPGNIFHGRLHTFESLHISKFILNSGSLYCHVWADPRNEQLFTHKGYKLVNF